MTAPPTTLPQPPTGPQPAAPTQRAAERIYRSIWAVVTRLFFVPAEPPSLPTRPGETLHAFKPAPEFVRYLKFIFWFWLAVVDGIFMIAWIAVLATYTWAGVVTAPLFIAIIVVPDIVAYVAIHLRYDSTWYLLSPRSLRIRRGIWTIHETTITFENIQNVEVRQGPLQRWYGLASLTVKTAGGGGGGHGHAKQGQAGAHIGLIEGVTDAARIRELILEHVAAARTAGLGDEPHAEHETPKPGAGLTPAHLAVLRDIRDLAAAMRA